LEDQGKSQVIMGLIINAEMLKAMPWKPFMPLTTNLIADQKLKDSGYEHLIEAHHSQISYANNQKHQAKNGISI